MGSMTLLGAYWLVAVEEQKLPNPLFEEEQQV
jgi:hypothetical protein